MTSSTARSTVSSWPSATPAASSDLPDVGHLRKRYEGVVAVGVQPEVAAHAPVDGHELAVVDAGAVGQGEAHPMALELLQLSAISLCHGRLRLHWLSSSASAGGRGGLDR